MIVKMCRNNISRHIICRMLHRSEWVDIFPVRKYNNSSRMLSGTSADTGTSLNNPVNFASSLSCSPLFKIVLYISECGFIRKGTDGSRLEGLTFSEYNLCIMMGIGLILSWEVQVNIRLLISFESKEGLKGNVKALFGHPGAALWTDPVWHIASRHTGKSLDLRRIKVTVLTLRIGAQIMGWQRIYLCNTRHGSR